MDSLLLSFILNGMWSCITFLFLVYKFTSFFSQLRNMLGIVGTLFRGTRRLVRAVFSWARPRRGPRSEHGYAPLRQTRSARTRQSAFGFATPDVELGGSLEEPDFEEPDELEEQNSLLRSYDLYAGSSVASQHSMLDSNAYLENVKILPTSSTSSPRHFNKKNNSLAHC